MGHVKGEAKMSLIFLSFVVYVFSIISFHLVIFLELMEYKEKIE